MSIHVLYRRNTKGTVTQWRIQQFGVEVVQEWGIEGGQVQRTHRVFQPQHRKDGTTCAMEYTARQLKAKRAAGFTLSKGTLRASHTLTKADMDFTKLPSNFRPQKPIQELPSLLPISFLIHRKRDGQRHYALWTDKGRVRLYSSTMHEMTSHMPLIVQELEDLRLPSRTVLDGEIICDRRDHDDFRATNTVCRSLPDQAQFNERRLPIKYMPFDMLFYDGKAVWQEPYVERWERLITNVEDRERILLPNVFTDFIKAQRAVQRNGWEGLVLWNLASPNALRMDGRYTRAGCYKWKPVQTGEFVATGWLPGNGRLAKTMGRLVIAEWQEANAPTATDALMRRTTLSGSWDRGHGNRQLVDIGHVGTGFDNTTRKHAMRWKYPLVVELKYTLQQPDTRALREPVFIRVREDKTVKEL